MKVSPFVFSLGESVKLRDAIRSGNKEDGEAIIQAGSLGVINALTVSKKGTHASVTFKFRNARDRTLLLNEQLLVRA